MSRENLRYDAERWYSQAVDDAEAASALLVAKKYAQACFYAQQSGEKAMKAVWFELDLDPWGHSVGRLIRDLTEDVQEEFMPLLDEALALDKLYIPTRYPDALANLTPAEAYTQREAGSAIQSAQVLLDFVQEWRSRR